MEIKTQTEPCLLCSSVNHIFLTPEAEAYECFYCGNKMWLDDQGRLEYMISRNRSLAEAEADLQAGKPIFADCHCSV